MKVSNDCCALVPNATTGIETVIRNLVFQPGDVMICFANLYPAFANTFDYLSTITPLEMHKIEYVDPVFDGYICAALESAISSLRSRGKTPKVALFDTISSFPAVRMPFERLTAICKTHSILSLIDGAHSVGQIPLELVKLDPDFFVSNLHKWLYVPRGCAVMYVPERNHHLLKTTLPTGFHYGDPFAKNFADTATMDNSPFLCVPAAIEWRKRVVWRDTKGEDAVMDYLLHLSREGGKKVAAMLGTEVMENEEGSIGECSMTNIRLPLSVADVTGGDKSKEWTVSTWMMNTVMIREYETAVMVYPHGGKWWVRLSAQVYLTLDDFEYAGEKLLEACERVRKGEWMR